MDGDVGDRVVVETGLSQPLELYLKLTTRFMLYVSTYRPFAKVADATV